MLLIILSATTAERSDSMAASRAIVSASCHSLWIIFKEKTGSCGVGILLEISYRSPIVLTCIPSPDTIAIPISTANRDAGTFGRNFAPRISTARLTTPTSTACQFSVAMFCISAISLSIVSISGSCVTMVSPQKSLIWPIRSVTAIPAVNPVVIVYGMNLIRLPIRRKPMMTSRIPAIMVATASPSIPLSATIPATIVAKAAVGPAICTLLPPRKEITKPATIAV